jgi:hypothetical protein
MRSCSGRHAGSRRRVMQRNFALVGRQIDGADLVTRTAAYFVAFTKSHRFIEVIGIRFAGSEEHAIFLR